MEVLENPRYRERRSSREGLIKMHMFLYWGRIESRGHWSLLCHFSDQSGFYIWLPSFINTRKIKVSVLVVYWPIWSALESDQISQSSSVFTLSYRALRWSRWCGISSLLFLWKKKVVISIVTENVTWLKTLRVITPWKLL